MLGRGRQSLAGRLRLRAVLAASPAPGTPASAQAPAKVLFSEAPPGLSEGLGAIGPLCAPLRRRPRGRASLARGALVPRSSSPADRSRERRGAPAEGRAGVGAQKLSSPPPQTRPVQLKLDSSRPAPAPATAVPPPASRPQQPSPHKGA